MEITKQNQTFNINDTTSEGWTITGSATQDVDGYITISFNTNKDGELNNQVGYYNYSIPKMEWLMLILHLIQKVQILLLTMLRPQLKKLKIISLTKQFLSNMGRKKPNSPRAGLSTGGKCGGGKKTK